MRDIRYACLTRLLGMKVEIYQLPTLLTSLQTSSPTSGGPLAYSGSLYVLFDFRKTSPLAFLKATCPQETPHIECI